MQVQAEPGGAEVRCRPTSLQALVAAIFEALGAPSGNAAVVSEHLVDANLVGCDSHGVIRVPEYVSAIRGGHLRPEAVPALTWRSNWVAEVRGRWGFGQVAAHAATEAVVGAAKAHGLAAACLRQVNHLGRLGAFVDRAATAGCVAFMWAGGLPPIAVPFGARRPAYGANPFAAGFPASPSPFVLDFATTAAAVGKVLVAEAGGLCLPDGVLIDEAGEPTTDPTALRHGGALLPFGGHKGSALAMLAELLSTALIGEGAVVGAGTQSNAFGRHGAVLLGIDVGLFAEPDEVLQAASVVLERIREAEPAPGVARVMAPGDPERSTREQRLRDGIALPAGLWTELAALAEELGCGHVGEEAVATKRTTGEPSFPHPDAAASS